MNLILAETHITEAHMYIEPKYDFLHISPSLYSLDMFASGKKTFKVISASTMA